MSEDADEGIPEPFDDMPTIDDPSPSERRVAVGRIPPRAIPDDGPIPDNHHIYTIEKEITVPAWVFEAVRYRLRATDPDELDRDRVEEYLIEYAQIHERFVTDDGDDAVELLLEEFGAGDGGA